MSKLIVFCISILFTFNSLKAQNFEAGLTLGATHYNGDVDIAGRNFGSSLQPAIGILGKYRFANRFLLRGQALTGTLSATEKNHPMAWRQERGFAFTSRITELTGLLEYEFLRKGNMTAYAFGGLGATFFRPNTDYSMPNPFILTDINEDLNTNYRKVTPAIPLGIGAKYALKWHFNLGIEAGYRKVFTDYLDGISKIANPQRQDMYFIANVVLTKEFGGGKRAANRLFEKGDSNCPKF
jgi:OmpA-OmpF porin, OOP family